MATGFERHISGGPARLITRQGQGHGFRMGTAAGLRKPAPDDAMIFHKHAADGRVGPTAAQSPPRQGKGGFHILRVIERSGHDPPAGLSSSAIPPTKFWKSFASLNSLYTEAKRT